MNYGSSCAGGEIAAAAKAAVQVDLPSMIITVQGVQFQSWKLTSRVRWFASRIGARRGQLRVLSHARTAASWAGRQCLSTNSGSDYLHLHRQLVAAAVLRTQSALAAVRLAKKAQFF